LSKSRLASFFGLLAGMGALPMFKEPKWLKGIDIEKEYELIKQKKSNLSASQRAEVVARYEWEKKDREECKRVNKKYLYMSISDLIHSNSTWSLEETKEYLNKRGINIPDVDLQRMYNEERECGR